MKVNINWRDDLGEMAFEGVSSTGKKIMMDSSEAHGGKGLGPTPMEVLLMSVAGCTAMDVISILRKKRQEVKSMKLEVNGKRADDYPKEYTHVTIKYTITGKDIKPDAVKRAIELSQDQYCGASATLKKRCEVDFEFEIKDSE